jgi:hypothetical protein
VGGSPIFGSYKIPGSRLTAKCIAVESWLINMIKANGITKVYIEAPIVGKFNSYQSTRNSFGLNTVLGVAAAKCGADAYDLDQQTWRSGFMRAPGGKTGITLAPRSLSEHEMMILMGFSPKSNSDMQRWHDTKGLTKVRKTEARRRWLKKRTIEECYKRGYDVGEDDDAADALGMWIMQNDKVAKKAASPEFDLLGGFEI